MEPARDTEPTAASGGGMKLRLFASIAVPAAVARPLAGISEDVASRTRGAVAVTQGDLHVTFAFLGPVAEEYVPAVAAALEDAARTVPGPVACTLTGTAPFGGGRVLGATVDVDLLAVLSTVREGLLDAVRPYAPDLDERGWHPHVSLVRAPRDSEIDMPDARTLQRIVGATWVASGLTLLASLPGPAATFYRHVHEVPFGEHALLD